MPTQFKVAIVGGGIAGLTLANALQHAEIDYVLLEARTELAPQLGASIGLGPNGSRILDQLECYNDIMDLTVPIEYTGSHRPDGTLLREPSDAFKLVQARANYCMCFLDRRAVLRVLANHIREPERVHLNKRVRTIVHSSESAVVQCEDGSTFPVDVVIGADGAYSHVRSEMWRNASQQDPGSIPETEQKSMSAEYRCLFGISPPQEGLPSHCFDTTYIKDLTPIVITGKGERVYWFLIERMPQRYPAGQIPRFTTQDAETFAAQHARIPLTPNGDVRFKDLWGSRETCSLVALEEAYFNHWTWGRFACLGDSVHKMTPNMGAGGNSAIESAATLANTLHALAEQAAQSPHQLSLAYVQDHLARYQTLRQDRAGATVRASNYVTRLHAVRGLVENIMAHHVLPKAGDFLVDLASLSWIGAARIEYLPLPPRSLGGSMPFNPQQGIGQSESLLRRVALAFPLLLLVSPKVQHLLRLGVQATAHYSGSFLSSCVAVEGQGDVPPLQLLRSVTEFGVVYCIMLIESGRRANLLSPMRIPIWFGLASQYVGAATAMPIYYFLYSTLVPISSFRALDLRLTDLSYTRSVLPVMLGVYYIPYLVSICSPDESIRRVALGAFKTSPAWISLAQWLIAKCVTRSTIRTDRITRPNRDVKTIRWSMLPPIAFSAVAWFNTLLRSCGDTDLISYLPTGDTRHKVRSPMAYVLDPGYLSCSASSLFWTVLLFTDLKQAGMLRWSWLSLVGMFGVSAVLVGPGASLGLMWLYREYTLATKRHKGALVKDVE